MKRAGMEVDSLLIGLSNQIIDAIHPEETCEREHHEELCEDPSALQEFTLLFEIKCT